ncbi:hypothetical protein [Nocardiopsis composta]|uniref:Uncharacterized protein n=1 Tax=Nocardiopsis composta TaxID=157465 RepID=A0A7W8VD40_9ACTN|nr:hypothetical protein [Nocardiopsis composta]MBB5431603.1 hypothetical protein [Nocardiopsis composta]
MPDRRFFRGGSAGRPAFDPGPPPEEPTSIGETACYWLLYVVGLSGAFLHWQTGNRLLAFICLAAAVSAVHFIVQVSRTAD